LCGRGKEGRRGIDGLSGFEDTRERILGNEGGDDRVKL